MAIPSKYGETRVALERGSGSKKVKKAANDAMAQAKRQIAEIKRTVAGEQPS
jgi:hypothetical protein